jgi:quinolinate synthase
MKVPGPLNQDALPTLNEYKAMPEVELSVRIEAVREKMGEQLLILGHHYQRDEVIEHTDFRGDSFKLSAEAARRDECFAIVFCGVHFMAETADILANRPENLEKRDGKRTPVILPNLFAGCTLADMATLERVEACWQALGEVVDLDRVVPITYVNSNAQLKAFCGRHGGIVCTSSNASAVLDWALERGERVLFFPDQHLARNIASSKGFSDEEMPLWDDRKPLGGNTEQQLRRSRVILWNGYCCVHQVFTVPEVEYLKKKHPDMQTIIHPESPREVVEACDRFGSTGAILKAVEESPPGSVWGIGTEWNMVQRVMNENPDKEVHYLAPEPSVCGMMERIRLHDLCWVLENLIQGNEVNVIEVEPEVARDALVALERMLEVS